MVNPHTKTTGLNHKKNAWLFRQTDRQIGTLTLRGWGTSVGLGVVHTPRPSVVSLTLRSLGQTDRQIDTLTLRGWGTSVGLGVVHTPRPSGVSRTPCSLGRAARSS